MRLTFLAAAALAAAALARPAAAEPYLLDKSHAAITFSVDHLGFSWIQGRFRAFDAQIDFDPDAVEETRLRFVIDPASVDTDWAKRDEHLRSADFFDVENHPEIVFVSTAVNPTGAEQAEIAGELTIKGITRPVLFEAELNRIGPSPLTRRTTAGFTATGVIDRTEFDLGYAAPEVGAEVPVRIDVEILPASPDS